MHAITDLTHLMLVAILLWELAIHFVALNSATALLLRKRSSRCMSSNCGAAKVSAVDVKAGQITQEVKLDPKLLWTWKAFWSC